MSGSAPPSEAACEAGSTYSAAPGSGRAARDVTVPEAAAVLQIFRARPPEAAPSTTTWPAPAGSESDSASDVTGAAVAEAGTSMSREAAAAAGMKVFTLAQVGRNAG